MELRKGYKQTEVGVIPEDWEVVPLKEITTMMTNGFVGTATTHYTNSNDGVTYIQGYNIENNSFNFHGIKKVSVAFNLKNKKSILREGDLLTVQTGDVGLTSIVPKELEGANCHALIISRFNLNKVFPKFYSQYFNSNYGRSRLKELETGTTMKHINVGELQNWIVPLPPTIEEQRAIAGALSDVDELISSLEKLITKKKALKQGAMQQLLTGKTRLKGFEGSGKTKQTELGEIPEEWELKKFEELGEALIGLTYSPTDVSKSGKLVHRSSNIQQNRLAYNDNVFVTCSIPEKLILKEDDILICVRNGSRDLIGKAALIEGKSVGETFGAFMSVFRANVFAPLLFQYFISNIVQYQINASLGATINQITNKTLNDFLTPFPTNLTEQKAIAQILSDMDSEIEQLETKKAKYQTIKQGMMQELLTGKTRLV